MSRIRILLLGVVLLMLLSACELTVQLDTKVEADGSGSFALGMVLDKEVREFLEGQVEGEQTELTGLTAIEDLFGGLVAKGWRYERSEPAGGLLLRASTSFRDADDFDRVLSDLRSARAGSDGDLGKIQMNLGFETEQTFLRNRAEFRGEFDTSGGEADPELLEMLRDLVRFEIRAELPGTPLIADGSGTVSDGAAVWRPRLGESLSFSAESTGMRVGSMLAVVLPLLVLAAVLAWLALGRKRRPAEPDPGTSFLTMRGEGGDEDVTVPEEDADAVGARDA